MPKITHVRAAQQRYEQIVVTNPDGTPKQVPVMSSHTGQQKVSKKGPVFLTVKFDDKTKPKPPLRCDYCGKDIEIGTPYKHVTPRSGPRGGQQRNRHELCPTWRPSQLSSSKMAAIMAAQEALDDTIGQAETFDDIQQLVADVAQAARDVSMEYAESADNIEAGFGHEIEKSSELREKSEALESWADELESALSGEDEEPTVDHKMWTICDSDGIQLRDTDEFDDEDSAETALAEYATENDVDPDLLHVEENDADEPNQEETDEWLDHLREVAADAVNEVPV